MRYKKVWKKKDLVKTIIYSSLIHLYSYRLKMEPNMPAMQIFIFNDLIKLFIRQKL